MGAIQGKHCTPYSDITLNGSSEYATLVPTNSPFRVLHAVLLHFY